MMKKIVRTRYFRQVFRQRIRFNPELLEQFYSQLELFLKGDAKKTHPHKLRGKMLTLKSFSITEDIRVIYKEETEYYIFLDIGTHQQVYK